MGQLLVRSMLILSVALAMTQDAAYAQTPAEFLREYIEWVETKPSDPTQERFIGFVLVSNQKDRNVVGYAEGTLRYIKGQAVGNVILRSHLNGDGVQYFNDRRWGQPSIGPDPPNPFDPRTTDRLGLRIAADGTDAGKVTLTLRTWGNAEIEIQTQVADGILYGVGKGVGTARSAMFVLSLSKQSKQVPR